MDCMEYRPGVRWMIDDGENQIVIYLDAWPRVTYLDIWPCGGAGMKLPYSGTHVDIYWFGKLMRSMDIPADEGCIFRREQIDEYTDRITFPDGTIVDMHPDNGEPVLRRCPY